MKSLTFIIPETLLDKVVEEAERLGVPGGLLMRVAIIAFAENPSDSIEPLPLNYNKEVLKEISLTLPEDVIKKIHLYVNSKGFSIRRIVWSMINNFLNFDDEQKMFYIKKVKEILPRARNGRKYKTKLQETIVLGDLNVLVATSFKYSKELHKLLENEAIKKHTTVSELIREAVEEFLKKYSDNFEEIRKLHETASNLFSEEDPQKELSVKFPARVLLQLEKISGQTLVSKSAIIRLAIMNHFNLLNESVTKQRKATQNEAANDPPDDPPPQNYKPKPRWAGGFVSVLLPEPLYDLLKEYVMLRYHRGFIL
ncbi:MAG: ribbon-helix-helix protein, CopG family, partial [Thermoplasmata archaeon]